VLQDSGTLLTRASVTVESWGNVNEGSQALAKGDGT
jgi:hypothetical protein